MQLVGRRLILNKPAPDFILVNNAMVVTLTTHAANGLTENDFIIAQMINELGE
jgi:pterin-4a-carbinolamine dehydratase